jgi:hypothetical protein
MSDMMWGRFRFETRQFSRIDVSFLMNLDSIGFLVLKTLKEIKLFEPFRQAICSGSTKSGNYRLVNKYMP